MTKHPGAVEGEQAEARERLAQKITKQPLHDWDAPDWSILDDRRGELPEFPLDCLPAPVRAWVERAANGAGVTPAHVGVPALGVASSLIGMARRVQASRSWRVPMTCWSVVVGASGTGKTPGLDVIKRALDWMERANRTKVGALRRQHETRAETAKAARAQWKKQVEEAVAAGQAGPQMPEAAIDPGQFIEPRPYISDVTIERIGPLLQARPQGTLLLRDELSALFLNMSRYSGGQDKPFWLEAWNGGSSVIERVSRSLYIKHLLVGVAGGIQPSLLEPSFEGDHDGMYTRFLFAWPPKAAYRALTDDANEVDTDVINVITRLDRLAEIEDGSLVLKEIALSKEARAEFEGLRKWADREQEAFDEREREWMAKAAAHALRLSGTLCLLDWAASGVAELIENEIVLGQIRGEPTEIGAEHMRAAIRLVQGYFWPHARAALRRIGLNDRHVNARRVLRWIRGCRKADISIEDIRRDALGQRLDAEGVLALLAALERSGWVRKKETKVSPEGGRPAHRWDANPLLFPPAETAETAQTYTNDCPMQPAGGVSAVPAVSASERVLQPADNGMGASERVNGGMAEHTEPVIIPSDDLIPEDLRRCEHCNRPGAKAQDFNGRILYLHDDCHHRWADAAQANMSAAETAETAQTSPAVTGRPAETANSRICVVCGGDLYQCFPLKCPLNSASKGPH